MKTIATKQIEDVVITCDECGTVPLYPMQCSYCKKDMCQEHRAFSPLTDGTGCDYPTQVCKDCAALAAPFASRILQARDAYNAAVVNESAACLAACRVARDAKERAKKGGAE